MFFGILVMFALGFFGHVATILCKKLHLPATLTAQFRARAIIPALKSFFKSPGSSHLRPLSSVFGSCPDIHLV